MSDNKFNALRTLCELVISAIAVFYVTVGKIWGWPYIEAIAGTLAAVNVLIGSVVTAMRKAYNIKQKGDEDNG